VGLMVSELIRGLEEPSRRRAAAAIIASYAAARKPSPEPLLDSMKQLLDVSEWALNGLC
jgi:hypothetical protein